MSEPVPPAPESLVELHRSLAGVAIAAGDPGYDLVRRCFNALIDRRPAVIARCRSVADVATSLDFARSHGLELAVRGGGHNPSGHCVCDGGLVIDLSLMRAVAVDAGARRARSQGGATWLDFDSATQAHGLVTPGGVVGSTGVAGLTFGGGIGHLTAQHGLTGVAEALRRYRDVVAAAPRDLSCGVLLAVAEPLEPVMIVSPCYTGADPDPGWLRELRSAPGLVDDRLRE